MNTVLFFLAAMWLGANLPLDPTIIRRHDRADEQYLALGKQYGGSVCLVGSAAGTLIGSQWIVTAAHVAGNISPFSKTAVCGGESIPVTGVYTFPGLRTKTSAGGGDEIDLSVPDLALVSLARSPKGVVPMKLYREKDEVAKRIVVVGNGAIGTGETGPTGEDGKLRAATNIVDALENQYFTFTFSPPDDSSTTPLEGIGGPGDSGGPAIIVRDGQSYVAGVSSINSRGPLGPSAYKSTEVYARISTNTTWIDSIMAGRGTADAVVDTVKDLNATGWPSDLHGTIVKGWFDSFNSQDSARIVEFNREFKTDSALKVTSAEKRANSSKGVFGDWGSITAHRYVATPGKSYKLLVHSDKLQRWMSLEFSFEGDKSDKLGGLRLRWPEDPPA